MIVSYSTEPDLRELCAREEEAARHIGPRAAAALMRRLDDLRAAESAADIPRIGITVDNGVPEMRIMLDDRVELVIAPRHKTTPLDATGECDWCRVFRVKVTAILVTHDEGER
jgi:hypothetical protein